MLEVMQILGKLKAQGWRPLRSIIFASWDAAEYNLMGSTEWVEDNLHELRRSAVAYINVGAAVSGTKFEASASPLYKRALQRVLGRVSDPTQNKTFGQIWEEQGSDLKGLGSGGDYVAFQDLAGTSSIDMGFRGDALPYHSCYDTYEWMERFGDPDFSYHKALAEIWVLLILELSQEMLVPFNFHDYSSSLTTQLEKLTTYSETRGAPMPNEQGKGGFDMTAMYDAARSLKKSAHDLDEWENWWRGQVMGSGGLETNALAAQRMAYNSKLSDFETDLLDISRTENKNGPFGVPGREQFKHVVFGPQEWSGYGESYFPFIRDAIDAKDWEFAQTQVEKTARIISAASEKLRAK
jgi:N-acetylated-alpha-linked acidic dipeptidase